MKICASCGTSKELSEFSKSKARKDNLDVYCRGCKAKLNAIYNPRRTPTYISWMKMMDRCNNPSYHGFHRYGGRGITVDPSWYDYKQFHADMGDRPEGKTLDRIDNDKGYGPNNCKWSTPKEQAQNRRPRQSGTKAA